MLKLKIVSYFTTTAFDLLINSNKLNHTIIKLSKSILVNQSDMEEIDKILNRNSIKYRL